MKVKLLTVLAALVLSGAVTAYDWQHLPSENDLIENLLAGEFKESISHQQAASIRGTPSIDMSQHETFAFTFGKPSHAQPGRRSGRCRLELTQMRGNFATTLGPERANHIAIRNLVGHSKQEARSLFHPLGIQGMRIVAGTMIVVV